MQTTFTATTPVSATARCIRPDEYNMFSDPCNCFRQKGWQPEFRAIVTIVCVEAMYLLTKKVFTHHVSRTLTSGTLFTPNPLHSTSLVNLKWTRPTGRRLVVGHAGKCPAGNHTQSVCGTIRPSTRLRPRWQEIQLVPIRRGTTRPSTRRRPRWQVSSR